MDELRIQQREVLETVLEYTEKLKKGINEILDELKVCRKHDTIDFLRQIVDGLNWVIEAVNGTLPMLNEGKVRIVKESVNQAVDSLSEALRISDDIKIAEALEMQMLPFLSVLREASEEVLSQ